MKYIIHDCTDVSGDELFDFVSEYSLQCSIAAASPAQSELYVYIVGAGAFSVFMKSRNAVAASLGQEKLLA